MILFEFAVKLDEPALAPLMGFDDTFRAMDGLAVESIIIGTATGTATGDSTGDETGISIGAVTGGKVGSRGTSWIGELDGFK